MSEFIPGGPPRYEHQKRALNKIIETNGICALLIDPGGGKTATAIDYASILALKSITGEARILVVAPLAAVDTWVTQCELFASPQISWWAEALGGSIPQRCDALEARGGTSKRVIHNRKESGASPETLHYSKSLMLRHSEGIDPRQGPRYRGNGNPNLELPRLILVVTNISTFSSRAPRGSRTMADHVLNAVKQFNPHLMVIDESHIGVRRPRSNTSKLMARVSPIVPRRLILTGTVMPTSPLDIMGQWRFLEPYAFGRGRKPATVEIFRNRYAVMGGFMGREIKGYKNLDELQEIMSKNAIVVKKEDALDLPPTTDVIVHVDLSSKEKKAYAQMKDTLKTRFSDGTVMTAPHRLAQIMRLRQLTSGFLPDNDGEVVTIGTSKIDTIRSLVHDTLTGEKRIVIFALFTHEIEALSSALAHPGTIIQTITGATPPPARINFRKRFGSDENVRIVMIAQISTMSLAVNELVTASHAVFGSMSQRRDEFVQAKARLDRSGQTRPVTFWHCIAPSTIDSVILQSHEDRSNLERALLTHIIGKEFPTQPEQGEVVMDEYLG